MLIAMDALISSSNLLTLLLFGLVTVVLIIFLRQKKKHSFPPTHSGWVPWMGCAIEFGKSPLQFISSMKEKVIVRVTALVLNLLIGFCSINCLIIYLLKIN